MSELKTASVDSYIGEQSASITFQYETNDELIEVLRMLKYEEDVHCAVSMDGFNFLGEGN